MYEIAVEGRKETRDIIAGNMLQLFSISCYLGFGIGWKIVDIKELKQGKKSKVHWDDMIMPNDNQLN